MPAGYSYRRRLTAARSDILRIYQWSINARLNLIAWLFAGIQFFHDEYFNTRRRYYHLSNGQCSNRYLKRLGLMRPTGGNEK